MRKICIITGTRAEYGLLSRLMKLINECEETQLQLIATNMHLMEEYGNTYKEIEQDGFNIDYKVYMYKKSDDAYGIVDSMSAEMKGMNEAFNTLKPDIIVVLGDRYEIIVAVMTALIYNIPVAHIHGGEITEGAIDDSIRHAISKMSHLHFTSTEEYRKRVIQLGEQPDRVFNVGALGVENIKKISLMTKDELETSLDFKMNNNTILITYHPLTLPSEPIENSIDNFLKVLERHPELRIIFTMPNSDLGNDIITKRINKFVDSNKDRSRAFKSLGLRRYLSCMKFAIGVVGNSSSGIIETPSFGIPTINIGDRQKGRVFAGSVINCNSDSESIETAFSEALKPQNLNSAKKTFNPYEKENTAQNIFNVIKNIELKNLKSKKFYNL